MYSYKPETGHRSGLEDKIAAQIKSYEDQEVYENYYLRYSVPAKERKYTPDFILKNGIIIEAKGLFSREDRQKHLLIKSQYPHLDIRFVFQNANNKLYKGSKTTYGDWCNKYGFKFAQKIIPSEWFKECSHSLDGVLSKNKKG